MKKEKGSLSVLFTAALVLLLSVPLFSQQPPGIAFIDELSRRSEATMGDAVKFFVMTKGETSRGFAADLDTVRAAGILDDRDYSESDPLKKGDISFMTARFLELDDSLMYNIFKNRRYAVTACRAAELMPVSGGGSRVISGGELIDIMFLISEKTGGSE